MNRVNIIFIKLFFFVIANLSAAPLEIDITKGKIEPLPVAITKFNYGSSQEKVISNKIYDVISNDLVISGLFKKISNNAFLQSEEEVFTQPLFSDWSIIDANLIVSGTITVNNNKLLVKLKLWDVYREKLLLSKKIDGLGKDSWRTLAHIISNLVYQRVTGEKGYFDTKIAYISESMRGNKKIKRLAIMDYDGNAHQFLTDGTDLVLTPRFSPNGKSVAYLSFSKRKPTVYLLNLVNKKKTILGDFSGMSFAPRFSPDGKNIIFSLTDKGSSNIFILDILTKKLSQITKNKHINTSPSYAPNNNSIVFSSDRAGKQNLYIKEVSKGLKSKVKRITFGRGNYATPVWSPRGDYIAFTKSYKKSFYIGLINKDGTGERIISKGYLAEGPTWSPNGRTLAFYKLNKNNSNKLFSSLYTIDITGNLEKKLNTPLEASDPDWGPSIKY